MARLGWILGTGAAIACGLGGDATAKELARPGDLAIIGATVLPMDREATLAGQTVLIRGDRIVAVAPAGEIDARAATSSTRTASG